MRQMKEFVPYESEECYALVDYLRLKKIPFTHIPSENTIKNYAFIRKMKRMGVNKGFPDYIICPMVNGIRRMVFIEMKRVKGSRISPEQMEWHKMFSMMQWMITSKICYGAKEAIDFLEGLK